jgi:hypothetical protein
MWLALGIVDTNVFLFYFREILVKNFLFVAVFSYINY